MTINDITLWTALITPFDQQGNINFTDLEKLLREQEAAGNGVLILGSTGESLNMELEQQKEVIDFAIKLNLKVPLMAGVGGSNYKSTVRWIEYLETKKLDCYLLVTPLYAKPETKGQTAWFKGLMDLASKPVILYNVPSRTGKNLSYATVASLKDHPRFFGIKEASGSLEDFSRYRKTTNKDAIIFSGDDALTPDFAPLGAGGLISVASNIWPAETKLYVKKCLEQKLSPDEIAGWKNACDSLFQVSNPIPVKRLMAKVGLIQSAQLLLPLLEEDLEKTDLQEKAHQWVQNWYQSQL